MTRMNQMAMAAAGVFGVVALAVVLATTIHAADEPDIVETAAAQAEPAQSYRPLICPTFSDVSGSAADRSLCEKNLAKAERLHGMKSQQTAAAILDLAGYHAEWTESAKADPLFRRAIEAHDAAYGKNSARTALCLLVYADFLVKESRWREAVPLLERAVAIHERVSGPDHPETVLAVRSLGDVKDQLGDRAAAKALLDRERTSRKMILPQVAPTACDDPDYFRAHEHVGARLVQTGNIDAADYHFRRAIQLRPDLAENHNNLGVVLSYQSHINEAIDEFVEAKRLAPEVPAIAIHLANELTKAERYAEAEKEFKELLDKEPRNPALINNYGVALYKQGKREESIAQFKKALEIDPNLKDAQESLAVAVGEKPDPAAESPKPPPEE
jgi:Tfp pilus assembly protein PilF